MVFHLCKGNPNEDRGDEGCGVPERAVLWVSRMTPRKGDGLKEMAGKGDWADVGVP